MKLKTTKEIKPKCDYCRHNKGENKESGFMWYCSILEYYVVFGYPGCKAQKMGKFFFEPDMKKYRIYNGETNKNIIQSG